MTGAALAQTKIFVVNEDRVRHESKVGKEINQTLVSNANAGAYDFCQKQLKTEIASLASEALDEMSVALNKDDRIALNQELYDEVMGLGPLEPLLKDETINDILVNGPQRIFVERAGKLELTDITFKDERHLLRIIDKIVSAVGRRVDESNPYVDARLADGRCKTPWSIRPCRCSSRGNKGSNAASLRSATRCRVSAP